MSFVAHELTVNPDIQERLIDEIDDVRDSFEGKCISYDAIQGMKYMDMVVSGDYKLYTYNKILKQLKTMTHRMLKKMATSTAHRPYLFQTI